VEGVYFLLMSNLTKVYIAALAAVSIFLGACGIFGETRRYPPDDFNVREIRHSLNGSRKEDVIAKLGYPSHIFAGNKASYFIYEKFGTEIQLFIPYSREYPIYCYIVEFDESGLFQRLDPTSCSTIQKLYLNILRTEAKSGKIASASVLAVSFGEFAPLQEQAIDSAEAQRALTLIKQRERYKKRTLASLNDEQLSKRALTGDPEASYQLYWNKAGPAPHIWLCRAAELGQREARHRIADLYWYGGEGLRQDYLQSYKWYALAAESGDYNAWKRLRQIRSEVLTADDVARADALVRTWQPGGCKLEFTTK
jgi:hypothetical protein